MKKTFTILIVLLLLFTALIGCSNNNNNNKYSAQEILDAIKAAYGEDYLPSMEMDDDMVEISFNLDMSLVEEIAAEMPALTFHPDKVAVVKAQSGKGEAVEGALKAAQQEIVANGLFYPSGMYKRDSIQVVRNGDYVAFIMLGAIDKEIDSKTEEEKLEFAKAEVQKGVDAFNSLFN